MSPELISPELRQILRRLRLSPMLETLPERLVLARQDKMAYQDLLLLIFSDEAARRQQVSTQGRAKKAGLDPKQTLEQWDESAKVVYNHEMWGELCSLRFVEQGHHALLLGPVGVGKSFLCHSLGHIACRRGYSVALYRSERLFKRLKGARLDNTYEAELRKLIHVDLLILDDFAIDQMDAMESRDVYEIVVERHRKASLVVASNREPQEWLVMMSDPMRAQSAIDRLRNGAYELVIEGESYRTRQRPQLTSP